MCKKHQEPQAYASFDAKNFERRRLRLEQLLDNEIQRRGLSLPEPPAEPPGTTHAQSLSRLREHTHDLGC